MSRYEVYNPGVMVRTCCRPRFYPTFVPPTHDYKLQLAHPEFHGQVDAIAWRQAYFLLSIIPLRTMLANVGKIRQGPGKFFRSRSLLPSAHDNESNPHRSRQPRRRRTLSLNTAYAGAAVNAMPVRHSSSSSRRQIPRSSKTRRRSGACGPRL